MSAKTVPILRDIEQHKKTWQELWYRMADGDVVRYNEIKRMDAVYEFWNYFDFWREKQTKNLEEYRRKERQLKQQKK